MTEKVLHPQFCEVSLPVPLSQSFTYALPDTLRHRARRGCRILVPFAGRKLIGYILSTHNDPPEGYRAKEALRLVDEEPVLDDRLFEVGRFISNYYCAPLGEVLRGMAPLAGEVRQTRTYELTDTGRSMARQLMLGEAGESTDPTTQILRMLEARPLSAGYLTKKFADAARRLKDLEKKGLVAVEQNQADRDPARAASKSLTVEFAARTEEKLPKAERELLAYLELHPGPHNLAELETALKSASPAARALSRRKLVRLELESVLPTTTAWSTAPPVLNPHQQAAFDAISAAMVAGEYQPFLLEGVTGSGKTEVYLRAIDAALALGRGAILLVPEIALTPQMAAQFANRFGDRVAILHSAFNETERAGQWRRLRSGDALVAVGTRSGVFAPVRNLGLIIVDEEHDGSYKQEETPRYHGRDVAMVRGQHEKAVVVLGSATPSLESRYNVEKSKYTHLLLPERIEQRPMPEVEILDMRVEFLETRRNNTFSRRLINLVEQKLGLKEQVMLLLNRRGFSSFVACRTCGERVNCVNCAVTLTYHRRDKRLLCHYCNYSERVPAACPQCGSEHIYFMGTGAEKVEDELHQAFPQARIARMDRDTVTSKRHYEQILQGFREGSFDILVGTQMIAKGHDMPNVTLVGIVNADIGLGVPDFRAAERTFQLLTQAAGRAGRGSMPGQVVIQTIVPDHYSIRFAAQQNYALFYAQEIQFRRHLRYPPFAALANVVVRSPNAEDALVKAGELANLLNPPPRELKILGPAEAPVPRLRQEFRYQLLLKSSSRKLLSETLLRLRNHALEQKWSPTALVIDVDPLSLL